MSVWRVFSRAFRTGAILYGERRAPPVLQSTRLGTDPRHKRRYLMDMYRRRLLAGPEPERLRSDWSDWDRKVELRALTTRLGLKSSIATLENLFLVGNADELIQQGLQSITMVTNLFLTHQFPHLPQEFREQILSNFLTVERLAFVGAHLGLKDLIVDSTRTLPVPLNITSDTFCALIGAENETQGESHMFELVRDFLLTQLNQEVDVSQMFSVPRAEEYLSNLLLQEGYSDLEFRLLWSSAPHSPIYSCHKVGYYVNKELLASSFGETVQQAKTDCVHEALKVLCGLHDSRKPLDFSVTLDELQHDLSHKLRIEHK